MLRIIGLWQDTFVARIQQGHEGGKAGLGQAVGDQDIVGGNHQPVLIAQFFRKCIAQGFDAAQVRVMHMAVVQRLDCRLFDMRRRIGGGHTKFQMNQVSGHRQSAGEHAEIFRGG